MVASRATPKLLSKMAKQLRLGAPLVPPEPIQYSPERDVQSQQSERKDYRLFCETLAYVAKTVCQDTQGDTITNLTAERVHLHCSHHDLDVSIHDKICLHSSISVATNYLCFVSTILSFYQHFLRTKLSFFANAASSLGGELYM